MKQNPGDDGISIISIFTTLKRILLSIALVVFGLFTYKVFITRLLHGTRLDQIFAFLVIWFVAAYILIPHVHRFLTKLYIPDYFIGRIRTIDGLLSDPVNLVFIGNEDELHAAMQKAGWVLADKITFKSAFKVGMSVILHHCYDKAPVSSGYLFNKAQNFTYQHPIEGKPFARHHVRFFKAPEGWFMPGGHKVDWLAAGTFDRSIGFSYFTLQFTHRIASDTDIERDHIVDTLKQSGSIKKLNIIKNYFSAYHHHNGGGDRITTDGDLPIIELKH